MLLHALTETTGKAHIHQRWGFAGGWVRRALLQHLHVACLVSLSPPTPPPPHLLGRCLDSRSECKRWPVVLPQRLGCFAQEATQHPKCPASCAASAFGYSELQRTEVTRQELSGEPEAQLRTQLLPTASSAAIR